MIIRRDRYLNLLIGKMHNGQIKVITGIRRCGKSFLVFNLFRTYLRSQNIPDDHIIEVALDDDANDALRDVGELSKYIRERIVGDGSMHYVLLDEVQLAITREEMRNPDKQVKLYGLLNGLLRLGNVDIYVTGSNSKMLSKDVATEFRGRGDALQIHPLRFSEYYGFVGGDRSLAFGSYMLFGGMPLVLSKNTPDEKFAYLDSLFKEVYFHDILERYSIELPSVLSELVDNLCSSIGSLTNASKIAKTLKSVKGIDVDNETISAYLGHLTESFLFSCSKRYDVKGKRYFEYPSKYYCEDVGLRNVRLGLRQQEETHVMENIVYNELVARGFSVDVGVVDIVERDGEGRRHQKNCEIDFIARKGGQQVYIQSAYSMVDPEKEKMELRPLLAVRDFHKKVVVDRSVMPPWTDESGILRVGIYDFLLDESLIA